MAKYVKLRRANMAINFLDTNSTTHEFLFGALAELVDNARDAEAKNLHIYSIHNTELRGNQILCFRDDGSGMTPDESLDVIVFGKSSKKSSDMNLIGQYGNGLKSGAYRIGKEILIFTKKAGVGTIIFISGDFLAQEKLKEIVVPMPSFDMTTMKCYQPPGEDDATSRHNLELEVITKYSPFKTKDELIGHFNMIDGPSGTLVMIYKLTLADGESELDFETDPTDIQMRDVNITYERKEKSYPAHKSFREYASILYDDPRMQIFIQNKRVTTKILEKSLYLPAVYTFAGKMFKENAIKSREEAEEELQIAKTSLSEAKSTYQHTDRKYQNRKERDNKELLRELTDSKRRLEEAEKEVQEKTRQVEKRKREISSFQSLNFTFGINIHNRDYDGLFIYNGHRLLLMHESTKHQLGADREDYRGVVGVVNVPYFCAKPTANKQSFANQAEQRNLLNVMADCMAQYVGQLSSFTLSDKQFWTKYGYPGTNMRGGPVSEIESGDKNALKNRILHSRPVLQCCRCLKWRIIRPTPKSWVSEYYKDSWTCADNTDMENGDCSKPEDLTPPQRIPIHEYQKPKETNFREIEREVNLIPRDTSSFQRLEPRPAKTIATSRLAEDVFDDEEEDRPRGSNTVKRKSNSNSNVVANGNGAASKKSRIASEPTTSGATRRRRVEDEEDDENNDYLRDVLEMTIDVDTGHQMRATKQEILREDEKQIRDLSHKVEDLKARLKGLLVIMANVSQELASKDQIVNMDLTDLMRIDLLTYMKRYNKFSADLALSTLKETLKEQKQSLDKNVLNRFEARLKDKYVRMALSDIN